MDKVELADTIEAVRSALIDAMARGESQPVQFKVGPVQLEFQVDVTSGGEGSGKLRVWVLELGGSGSYQRESVQKLILSLEPVGQGDQTVRVERDSDVKP
jgi:Trypsin-co-occurring domain 2